jgi:putative transcriptional regulator
MTIVDSLKNYFLVASQDLSDGLFEKKVVYVLEHNHEGALGFMINHPIRSIKLKDLFEYFNFEKACMGNILPEDKLTVYQGGPSNIEKAFILYANSTTKNIQKKPEKDGLSLIQSQQEIESILINSELDKYLFTFGYAGWGPNQLEREIELGLWHIAPFDESIVFCPSPQEHWEMALNSININPNNLVSGLGHA